MADQPPKPPRLWSYSGTTARRKKRSIAWPDEPRRDEPATRRARRRTQPLGAQRYARDWVAGIAAALVGGAFLLILAQFNGWAALGLFAVLLLFALFELWRLGRRGRR